MLLYPQSFNECMLTKIRLVDGAGSVSTLHVLSGYLDTDTEVKIKLTKDGNVLLREMASAPCLLLQPAF